MFSVLVERLGRIMESKFLEKIKSLLHASGWAKEEILEEQSVSRGDRVYRPDIILIHNFNPLAVVEIKNGEADLGNAITQTFHYMDILNVQIGFVANESEILQLSTIGREHRKIQ